MRCCDITPAMLDQHISIERRTQTADGYGGLTDLWVADPTDGVWAQIKPLSGTESSIAMRTAPRANYFALIYFRGDSYGAPYYTPSDRVIWRGRTFDVISVLDVDSESRWLQLFLVEGAPS